MSAAFVCGPGANGGGNWPDVGNGGDPCCYESAVDGPAYCSCWEPVYEVERQPLQRDLEPVVRTDMCVDCAYRPSSPERTGDPNASGDADLLAELVERGQPFWCHQGVRRPIHWRHPSGATFEPPGMEHNYDYRIVDGTPYKADGTPADMCGGWSALRLKHLYREGEAST